MHISSNIYYIKDYPLNSAFQQSASQGYSKVWVMPKTQKMLLRADLVIYLRDFIGKVDIQRGWDPTTCPIFYEYPANSDRII